MVMGSPTFALQLLFPCACFSSAGDWIRVYDYTGVLNWLKASGLELVFSMTWVQYYSCNVWMSCFKEVYVLTVINYSDNDTI